MRRTQVSYVKNERGETIRVGMNPVSGHQTRYVMTPPVIDARAPHPRTVINPVTGRPVRYY